MAENVREAHLCQSIRGFEDCDEDDATLTMTLSHKL